MRDQFFFTNLRVSGLCDDDDMDRIKFKEGHRDERTLLFHGMKACQAPPPTKL
jgi:hypothetical protein